jgi:hypothetical protein
VTQEEFTHWKQFEPTVEILKYGKEVRFGWDELLHNLCSSCTTTDTLAVQAARLQGMILGINTILEMEWGDVGGPEDYMEEST